ncbi:MAG: hypothetical protein LC721_03655, partial [Actinobacteria bacterium]|nr:hypothetical protein [Actinomycetota bacterium]
GRLGGRGAKGTSWPPEVPRMLACLLARWVVFISGSHSVGYLLAGAPICRVSGLLRCRSPDAARHGRAAAAPAIQYPRPTAARSVER